MRHDTPPGEPDELPTSLVATDVPGPLALSTAAEREGRGIDFAAVAFSGTVFPEPRTSFTLGERVHWRARFGGRAGTVRLDIVTVVQGDDGWERAVSGNELWLAHPDVDGYVGWLDLPAYRTSGRFVLRLVRRGEVVAEGAFEVLEPLGSNIVH